MSEHYGFKYEVEFNGEKVEQLLIAPDKSHAEKAFEHHKQIAEKNPDKLRLISTEVEEIKEEDIVKESEEVEATIVEN